MRDPNVSARLSGVFMIYRKTSMDEELIAGVGVVLCIRSVLKEFWLVTAFKLAKTFPDTGVYVIC